MDHGIVEPRDVEVNMWDEVRLIENCSVLYCAYVDMPTTVGSSCQTRRTYVIEAVPSVTLLECCTL
jgi:hypothetical protein